jgi:hypothetical protein
MAYDEGLEARIDELMEEREGYEKKKMFGGICYLKSGNMAFGIWKDHLIVRCGPERHAEYLKQEHIREFDITGRPMSGWVMVAPDGIEEDSELANWMDIGDSYCASLPAKGIKAGGTGRR